MTQRPDAHKTKSELIAELQTLRAKLGSEAAAASAADSNAAGDPYHVYALCGCFDHVPFALWILDQEGCYQYQNSASRSHVGDLIGKPDPADGAAPGWREGNLRALQGEAVRTEVKCERNGRSRVYLADVLPIKRDGTVEMVIGAAVDVTTESRIIDQAVSAEEAWRSVVAQSPEIVTVVDREGTVLFANRTVGNRSVEEVIGTNLFDYLDEEFHEEASDYIKRVYETGESALLRATSTLSGTRLWFETHLGPVTRNGRIVAIACVTIDVTERESAAAALLESETRFRFSFEQAGVGIALLSPDCQWVRANKRLCEMLGYSADELLDLSLAEMADSEEVAADQEKIAKLLSDEIKAFSSERRFRTRTGETIWVDVTTALVRGEQGSAHYLISVFKEVTDRKRAEEELGRVTDHLEHRLQQRTAALANANEMLRQEIVERAAAVRGLRLEADRRRELEEIVHLSPAVAFRWQSNEGWPVEFVSANVIQFGYEAEQFTSGRLKYADIIHSDDLPVVEAAVQELNNSSQERLRLSYRIVDGGANTRWVEERSRVRRDDSGRVTHRCGVMFDNTTTRSVEERLQIISSAVEQSTEGVAIVNRQGDILFANRAFEAMRHDRSTPSVGGYSAIRRSTEGRSPLLQAIQQVWRTGQFTREIALPREGGGTHPALLYCNVLRDERGREIAAMATISDLSELRRAADELKDSERRFRQLSAAAFEGIAIHHSGKILDANQAMADLFGYERVRLIGMSRMDLVAPEERNAMRQFIRMHVGDEDMPPYETLGLKADGRKFPILIRGKAIPFEGRVGQVLAVQDITEGKRAAETWQKRLSDLAHFQRLSTMGELAAGLAHELNQPLSAISNYTLGCVRRIERDAIDSNELIERLRQVSTQALRAGKIIGRLRQFIKRREPRTVDLHLAELLRESVEFVSVDLRQAQIDCETDIPDELPMIQADPVQLQQVVVNLIRNACEAIVEKKPEERRIDIRVCRADDRRVEVIVKDSAGSLTVNVVNQAFEHFFTTKTDGLGMGLAISRSLIEAQGGILTADCEENGWTAFRFTVPIAQDYSPDIRV